MGSIMDTLRHALMITGFVAVMMLVVEYANILTEGRWQERLSQRHWGQYLLAAFLGATPGCLGAFAVVAMYSHRSLSVGAVVAAMIATAGDESFVMFAMIPGTALPLHAILFLLGILSGALTDAVLGHRLTARLSCEDGLSVHEEDHCVCFPRGKIVEQWKHCSAARGTLSGSLALFLLAIFAGQIGTAEWNWIRMSLALVSTVALFIVTTVPDHFLEAHLWRHDVCQGPHTVQHSACQFDRAGRPRNVALAGTFPARVRRRQADQPPGWSCSGGSCDGTGCIDEH